MENNARSGRNINPLEIVDEKMNVEENLQSNRISDDLAQEKKTSAVSGSNGTRISNSAAASAGTSPYDVIFSLMASLDKTELSGVEALDEAVQTASNGKFSSAQEVIDQLVSDCASTEGDSNTFLQNFCGIIMNNEDTGAITGYDTGYDGVKTAASVVPETGTRDTSFTDNEFTIKGFTFKLEKDFSELNDDEKFIWQSLYTYWAESSLNLIEESYGYSFEDDDITVNTITLKFITTVGGGTLADTGWWDNDGDGTVDEMDMIINTAYYNNFAEDDQDGISSSRQAHLDRTFAHEITHAIMNAKIKYRYELPMFISEGMAEITHGIDDVRTRDLQRLAADSSLLEQSLVLDPNYHTLAGITAPDYSGGYIFLRYLAWQSADIDTLGSEITNASANTVVSGSRFADTITNSGDSATVYANDFDDFVFNSAANAVIYGGTGADTLTSSGRSATLYGENGNDVIDNRGLSSYVDAGAGDDSISNTGTNVTIRGGSGDDTIHNAAHANIFVYSSGDGNDFISGFNENDTLEIQSGSFVVETAGEDALVSLTSGEIITLEGAAGLSLNVTGNNLLDVTLSAEGESYSNTLGGATIRGGSGNDTVYNSGGGVLIDAGDGDNYAYNSPNASGSTITAGSGNDTIHINGGSSVAVDGGSGDNSIYVDSDASNVEVSAGSGNDNVRINSSSGVGVTISGGDNTVYADSNSANITVSAGEGNDSINNWAPNSIIRAGDGVNTIGNSSSATNTTIQSGAGNDTITNTASSVSIDAGAGDDYVYSSDASSDVTMSAGGGNDTVQNFAAGAVVEISAGDNRVFNRSTGSGADLRLGSGNDTVQNWAVGVLADAGDGDNYVYNDGAAASSTLLTGAGNDTVQNSGGDVRIGTGAGNDYLYSTGVGVTLNAGAGDNTVYAFGGGSEIRAGAGNDTIALNSSGGNAIRYSGGNDYVFGITASDSILVEGENYELLDTAQGHAVVSVEGGMLVVMGGMSVDFSVATVEAEEDTVPPEPADTGVISLTSGDDSYSNDTDNVTIHALAGNDTVENSGNGVVIFGEDGADEIHSYGNGATISGGKGSDAIYSEGTGALFEYSTGDGNDIIYGVTENDTLTVTGSFTYSTSGDDAIINVGTSAITLDGAAQIEVNINGETYKAEEETIPTDVISLTSGADYYSNDTDNVTIHALAGNDTVENSGNGVVIFGEDGADEIHSYGNGATISGGKGSDTIYSEGTGALFEYSSGDGNDLIYGVTENDTLTVTGSFTYSTSGDDAIINVGTSAITLDGAAQIEVNINGETYKAEEETIPTDVISLTSGADYYSNDTDNVTIHALAGNDTVENSGNGVVIFGEDGADEIHSYGNGATISGGKGSDTIYSEGTSALFEYSSGDGNDIIYGVTENDTLTVTGSFTYSTSGDDAIVKVGTGAITLDGAAQLEININGETYKAEEETDTLPAGITISGNTMTVGKDFTGDSVAADEFDTAVTIVDASKLSRGISIVGTSAANSLRGGSGADTISGLAGDDTLTGGSGNDIFMFSAGNDVITDYAAGADKISISGAITSESLSGSNVVLKIGTGTLTINNAKNKNITIIDKSGAETTQVYPAVEETLPAGLTYNTTTKILTVDGAYTATALDVATLGAETAAKTVDASALTKAIKITGTKNAAAITGGSGNDTLIGGAGNDTLTGNAGADVFVYSGGNDVIKDYRAGEKDTVKDIISLASGSITSASVGSSNEIFKIGSGAVTVTGGKNQEISIGSAIYYNNVVYDSKKTAMTVGAAQTGTLKATDYASTVKVINATAPSKAVYIIGNAQANSMSGSKNNDTLSGGKGNDTLTGNAGADVFIYEAGSDIITDYTASQKDIIKLSGGSVTGATLKSNDLAVKTSSGAFTVKGGKGQEVTIGSAIYYNNLAYDSKKTSATIGTAQTGTLKANEYATGVKVIDASNLSKAAVIGNAQANTITGTKGADSIWGGAGNDVINGGAANDRLYGEAGNDKLNGDAGNDTLNGGAGNDTLTGGAGADVFIYDSGSDIITDYTAKDKDVINIGSAKVTGATLKSSDLAVKIGSGAVTIKGAKNQEVTIGSGIYFNNLTYDSKKTSATVGSAQSGTLKATDYATSIKKIDASNLSKAAIIGNAQANSILGGKGKDTLNGGAGNDTLTGGAGADVFIYDAGSDVITDYSAAQKDTVSIGSAKVTGATLKGSDLALKIGSGAVTLKGAKGQEVTIGSTIYYNDMSYDSKKTAVTLGSAYSGAFKAADIGKKVATIDGSAAAKAVNVTGNDEANLIIGGKGADTLSGGKGSDTLTGGDGKDVFVYNAGKDIITDYKAGKDTIQISGEITKTAYSGKDVIFTIDGDSKKTLTVKNGNGAKLTISENGAKATTVTYSSSNGNAAVPWFTEDDTLFAGGARLDDITAANYSVTNIENPNSFDALAQSNLLTITSGADN